MATYYVDSTALGLNDGTTKADAWTTPHSLPSLLAGDIVYIAHFSEDTNTYTASRTWVGPTSGVPARIISIDFGSDAHTPANGNQFNTSNGNYIATFDGAFAFYGGVSVKAGTYIQFIPDLNEQMLLDYIFLRPGANQYVWFNPASGGQVLGNYVVIDCGADTGPSAGRILYPKATFITKLDIANGLNRTGNVVDMLFAASTPNEISGGDWTSLTNVTSPELIRLSAAEGKISLQHLKVPASWTAWIESATTDAYFTGTVIGCGNGDAPAQLAHVTYEGRALSTTSITRTGGATFEGIAASWQITTTAQASYDFPYLTPWIYANIATTGTYELALFVTHDTVPTADYDDDEVWIEVQYKDEATGEWFRASDRVALDGTPAAQTDDSSTWSGAGPSYTYKQKLHATGLTVGATGLVRARACFAVASITTGSNTFLDPLLVVT